jgi:hypothetical protein
MTITRDERMAKSKAARAKRKLLKETLLSKTDRFYTRMRKLRKKKQKSHDSTSKLSSIQ